MILGVDLLEYLRIDDPIGAWPVHGLCGVWGTLSLGLFASGEYNMAGSGNSLRPFTPGHRASKIRLRSTPGCSMVAACIPDGSVHRQLHICAATFIVAMIVFKVLDLGGLLRISKEGEIEGMDLHEHGISAYPEYVISALRHRPACPRIRLISPRVR